MADMIQKSIVYFGRKCKLYCDGKCDKAWGVPSRPCVMVDGKKYWVADNEFDNAPDDPGTYEGKDGKPIINSGHDMNKWCARACERSIIVGIKEPMLKSNLRDFSKRILLEDV